MPARSSAGRGNAPASTAAATAAVNRIAAVPSPNSGGSREPPLKNSVAPTSNPAAPSTRDTAGAVRMPTTVPRTHGGERFTKP